MTFIQTIKNMGVGRKLVLIAMTTTIVALLIACLTFAIFERYRVKKSLVNDMSTLSTLIAERSNAALAFNDPDLAKESLKSLRAKPNITSACIYTDEGVLFSTYYTE